MLRDQWVDEVKKLYDMPVGIIGSGQFDIDHSIVVGNIQTLTKLIPKLHKEFGTVIIDESHHISASTFSTFLDGMYARYKIGLSGTRTRKDGRHIMFNDFFGPKVYQPPQSNTMTPRVRVIKTGVALSHGKTWVEKINDLLYDEEYQLFVATIARRQMDRGFKVLIIASRVEFLQHVKEILGDSCVCITGGTSYEERIELKRQVEDQEKDCVAGSRQIFSEGISINILGCVILAEPISAPAGGDANLEQIIGRIQREHPYKLQDPEVIDLQFAGPADRKQNNERLAFYARKGWEIK